MKISVSIVDDDAKIRESLASLINDSPGYSCVSTHPTAEDALQNIPKAKPDVTLMDINLPGMNGVECVRQLKLQLPKMQIVMLTVYQDTEHIYNALAAGATGYMLKHTPEAELLAAIAEVHAGGSPMSSHIARKIIQTFVQSVQNPATGRNEVETLTPRESQVLDLLAKGYLYKEIADAMNVAFATVHSHIRNIYEKLQVRSRTEAVTKHLSNTQAAVGHEVRRLMDLSDRKT